MLTWKIPSQYGVFDGPEIVPVQWNMSSSETGAAEHVGRGSFWRLVHSCLIRRRVILTFRDDHASREDRSGDGVGYLWRLGLLVELCIFRSSELDFQ